MLGLNESFHWEAIGVNLLNHVLKALPVKVPVLQRYEYYIPCLGECQ